MFDHLTLRCFIAVAECGGFTKAAERVGRTQSAVSQQIAKLEETLGRKVFTRGKTLALTAEGEIFLGYARRIAALGEEAVGRLRAPAPQGHARFGLPEDFAAVFLKDVLAEFVRIHPLVTLNVECGLTLNLFERFKREEFDLVLVKLSRPADFPHGVEIWSEPLEWVGDAFFADGRSDDGKPLPLVLSPAPCVYRARALEALERAGVRWRMAFVSPSYAGAIAAAKAGLGVTALPRSMTPAELRPLGGRRFPALSATYVSLLKRREGNAAVDSVAEFVLRRLRQPG